MAEPTIQLGGGNWAGKTDNLLGYYKEGERFYKQDFTFSRSTTGTYTDKDGYIQEMPYNKLLQSNQFDTTWGNYNSTETYDSNLNAWLIEKTGIYGFIRQFISLSGEQTLSVYAKASTLNWLHIKGSNNSAYFDLENGVLGSYNTTSASIESVGNGFYRCSITYSGDITDVRIYPADGNNDVSGTSGSIYIQNAQLNKGTSAKTYFPTTTRLNMPRVDYLNNSNGSLILEPQRSNLITYSEDFSQSYWSKSSITVTDGFISPSGDLTASKFTEGSTNINHQIYRAISGTAGNTYTLSGFFKKGERDIVQLLFGGAAFDEGNVYCNFDLENGVLGSGTYLDASITLISNGWYRCSLTATKTTTSNFNSTYCPKLTSTSSRAAAYLGDGTSGIYAYGAQLEEGSYPTTLINTSGSTVTRNQDTCSITNIADRIGQTEGTFYIETIPLASTTSFTERIMQFEASGPDFITFQRYANSNITFYGTDGSNSWIIQGLNLFVGGETIKIAGAYKDNDIVLYVNGVQIGTNNTANAPQVDRMWFANNANGSLAYSGSHKEVKFYNTRLSNSELATLTTL